jgi:AcrR family transcriptional regulator
MARSGSHIATRWPRVARARLGNTCAPSAGLVDDVPVAVWIGYERADGKRRTLWGARKAIRRCRRPLASHVRTLHMSWSREGGRSGPRGYHHGNLKEALIRAALELIAQKGPAGFTFAEAARWAGVSPAAPYRHFRDRDELLIDVARRGFDRFAVTLESAWDGGRPDAFKALDRLGKAYLRFARSEPAYYSAMFEAGIPPEASAELKEAGQRTFAVLRTATERLVANIPARNRPPVLMMTLHIWAVSHGIASLFGRGDAARRSFPMSPEDLLEAALLIYLRSLGLTAPPLGSS